jgi:hypothetical protein
LLGRVAQNKKHYTRRSDQECEGKEKVFHDDYKFNLPHSANCACGLLS